MAKFRLDYVTNSSSSSFIFARKNTCTVEEIRKELSKHIRDIEFSPYILDEYGSEGECMDAFAEWLYNMASGFDSMQLDDWSVCATECASEDDEFYGMVYYLGYLATENFKMG